MKTKHQIRVPFPRPPPPKDALYKCRFQAPESVNLAGSYALKAVAKHPEGITVDIAVTMPAVRFASSSSLIPRRFSRRKITETIDIFTKEHVTWLLLL